MSRQLTARVAAFVMLGLCARAVCAAEDPTLGKELTAIISSQGYSCGKVVQISTQAERDYLVACQDGSNYQIDANAQGKLVAHPLGQKIH